MIYLMKNMYVVSTVDMCFNQIFLRPRILPNFSLGYYSFSLSFSNYLSLTIFLYISFSIYLSLYLLIFFFLSFNFLLSIFCFALFFTLLHYIDLFVYLALFYLLSLYLSIYLSLSLSIFTEACPTHAHNGHMPWWNYKYHVSVLYETRTKTSIKYAKENDKEEWERRKERERKVEGEI